MSEHKERLGIYGGAFSPIHYGHINASRAFLDSGLIDKLLVVPTSIPPHKDLTGEATPHQRFEMTRLGFSDCDYYQNGRLEVCDWELTQEGKSFTVYTLEHFSSPERELYFLIGSDKLFNIDKWYRIEDILRLADIVLIRREDDSEMYARLTEKIDLLRQRYGARIHEIYAPSVMMSSTELREMLRNGADISGLAPDSVIKYIEDNKLYR
ncbi:MAG: nicotinate (nicotinamide) nucleotide adenylyltransferase [Clostridia bacterium]|nr:nicotinate (nicotinamide) nucleotide adenylyltransferase [Clostridia bacterium]